MSVKKYAGTIGLGVVAIGLSAYLWVDRNSVTTEEETARTGNLFPAWRREGITAIDISHGAEKTELRRVSDDAGGEDWIMTSPVHEIADIAEVSSLLASLEAAHAIRKVDAKDVGGFQAPRVTGSIGMSGIVYAFEVGAPSPSPEGSSYARVNGGEPMVISKELTQVLLQSGDFYREKNLVPYLSTNLRAFEIRGKNSGFRVERSGEEPYRLPELGGVRASRDKLDGVWSALAEARAEVFLHSAQDAGAGSRADGSQLTITMTPTSPTKAEGKLTIGGSCPERAEDVVVERIAPTHAIACAPGTIVQGLSVTADALVDENLFYARGDEVAEVSLTNVKSGASLDFARSGGGWKLRSTLAGDPREMSAGEAEAATALVARFAAARGKWNREEQAKPRAPIAIDPIVRAVIHGPLGEEEIDVTKDGAIRRADGVTLAIDNATIRLISPRKTSVRAHDVWPEEIREKPVSTIDVRCRDVAQRAERAKDAWVLVSPKGLIADAATIVNFGDALTAAKADAWVADADDGTFGLDGACTIEISVEPKPGAGTVTRTLTIGGAVDGGFYAREDGDPSVMILPQGLLNDARAYWIDKRVLRVPRDKVISLTVEKSGATIASFARPLPEDDGGRAAMLDALDALAADAVAHVGAPLPAEGLDAPSLVVRATLDAKAKVGGGTREIRLVFGREVDHVYFAYIEGVPAVFRVASEKIAPLLEAK